MCIVVSVEAVGAAAVVVAWAIWIASRAAEMAAGMAVPRKPATIPKVSEGEEEVAAGRVVAAIREGETSPEEVVVVWAAETAASRPELNAAAIDCSAGEREWVVVVVALLIGKAPTRERRKERRRNGVKFENLIVWVAVIKSQIVVCLS
jgi:hypothetical protein